jgi:hypothetical protein
MVLTQMELMYNFSLSSAEGNCKIQIGFENYFKNRIGNIELVVDLTKINLKDEYSHVPLHSIKNQLLKEFEKFKTEKYEWAKLQSLSKQYTPG